MIHCHEMEELLNDRLDGNLAPAAEAGVKAHLQDCAACRGAWEGLTDLRARTRALPAGIEPPAGLWEDVAARLPAAARPRTGVPGWALAAAAAVALAGVLVFLANRPGAGGDAGGEVAAALAAYQAAEEQYRRAGEALLAALEADGSGLPAASRETIQTNLALIDASIQEVRSALERHPDRPDLGYRLVELHRRKLGVLEQTTRILWGHGGSPTTTREEST